MTRRLSITTAVAVASLGVGAPAALANSVEPGLAQPMRDAHERSSGTLGSTLAGYQDAFERAAAYERARSSAVANYKDAFERSAPPRGTVPVSAPSSGTEIEWPQVGVGLGVGILLALGLGLIMRMVRVRPFATR
jgi:hypothetical protein